jgi:hypothetical protein
VRTVEPYILPLILLALVTTGGYFWGRKKNRWIGAWIARETEAALRPKETEYVNIGGCIGYHFTYALAAPFREAKGTFTLLPRHSLLYLPISILIRRHDRFYLQIFTDERLPGEGHILREDYYLKDKDRIAGAEAMRRDRVVMGGRAYVLLWKHSGVDRRLRRLVERLEGRGDTLLHVCCYPGNRNFFLYVAPVHGRLEPLLRAVVEELKTWLATGGEDGPGDAKKD